MMRGTLVLGLLVGANAGAVELTKDNFNELVVNSGKVRWAAPQLRRTASCAHAPARAPARRARSSSSLRLGEGTASR